MMIRKNLACLLSKHNSFVSSALYLSTWRETENAICPKVYDLLFVKHHFPPELASRVASDLARPENAESILSFLKESGCSTTQLHKIVKYRPRILSHCVEDIKFKIRIFQDLGLSPEDTAKMISVNQMILHLGAKSNIIPSLSVRKGLLGSDYDRLLRKSAWPLSSDLGKTLVPNVEFLKIVGVPMERILFILYLYPRFLLIKPDVLKESAEKAKEMGFDESSKMFVHALRVITCISTDTWEVKLQSFQEMGFSESETLTMFKKFPNVFTISTKKIEKVKQLLLATGKFNMPSIVNFPQAFGYNIEKKLVPRLRVLGILERENLIKKWPSLGRCCSLSYDKFTERYVRPYINQVGEAFVTKSCVKDKN